MSRDWWLLAPLAVGHVGVVVVLINVTHALGWDERRMARVKLALLAVLLGFPLGLAWAFTQAPWHAWPWPAYAYSLLCLATALVGLPLANLVRERRRTPPGVSERSSEIDLERALGADALIGTGKHSWMLRLRGNESLRLRKREWEVTLAGLPAAWDGLSLVHVTDLHFAPCFQRRYFEAVADEASAWEADLVLFTGDLIDHDAVREWIVPVMSRLKGRLGTYAILGNHDMTHQPGEICRELEQAGFNDLDGRWERLEIGGSALAIGGSSAPWGPALDLSSPPAADFRLLLSHSPDQFYRAARWGIDLMLAGHNHGGQIRLPLIGPVFMPSRYSRRFDRGYFQKDRTLMYVSQGVGGLHPVRYGCIPEVSRLVPGVAVSAGPSTAPRCVASALRRVMVHGGWVVDPALTSHKVDSLNINSLVINVPFHQQDPKRQEGQVFPPVFLARAGLLGAGDGVVADLDPVAVGQSLGGAGGDEAARGEVAFAEVELVHGERQQPFGLPARVVDAGLAGPARDERALRGPFQGLDLAVGAGHREAVLQRVGAEGHGLVRQVDLVAERLARVAQELDAVVEEKRVADLLEPVAIELRACVFWPGRSTTASE